MTAAPSLPLLQPGLYLCRFCTFARLPPRRAMHRHVTAIAHVRGGRKQRFAILCSSRCGGVDGRSLIPLVAPRRVGKWETTRKVQPAPATSTI